MGALNDQQSKSKRRKRKLSVQDRSFFEVPDDPSQLDEENSPIIDVVGVSPGRSSPTELSNLSGHHEEWHFSSLENTVVHSSASSHGSDLLTKNESDSKKEFVHRFLSDAISALGMGEECLNNLSDSGDDDITEAADLVPSKKQKRSKKVSGKSDMVRMKNSETRNEFSENSPLSSGQQWLLKQMSPYKISSSTNNLQERPSSLNDTLAIESEESLQVLEHFRPISRDSTTKKKKRKRTKDKDFKKGKTKEKRKKEKKALKQEERNEKNEVKGKGKCANTDQTLDFREEEKECRGKHEKREFKERGKEEKQNPEKKQKKSKDLQLQPNDVPCTSSDRKASDVRRHECDSNFDPSGAENMSHLKRRKVTVEAQSTSEEILHPSSSSGREETFPNERLSLSVQKKIKESSMTRKENVTNSLHGTNNPKNLENSLKVPDTANKIRKKKKIKDTEKKTSSSLRYVQCTSTIQHSPDLFDTDYSENFTNEQQNVGRDPLERKREDRESAALQQLVEGASSTSQNFESTSIIQHSPDLFDADTVDDNKSNDIVNMDHQNEQHESDLENSSYFHSTSSNKSKRKGKVQAEKRNNDNTSPEQIESHSPWHRLSRDSNGSFTGPSAELSKTTSEASDSDMESGVNNSHGQGQSSHSMVETAEPDSEEILPSTATLHLSSKDSNVSLERSCKFNKLLKGRKKKEQTDSSVLYYHKSSLLPVGKPVLRNKTFEKALQRKAKKNGRLEETGKSRIPREDQLKCTRCYSYFDSELLMTLHKCINLRKERAVVEPERKKAAKFKCECGKVYLSNSSLGAHIRSFHQFLRPYKCDNCPMSFDVKQTLIVHQRIHSNILPFECRICSKQTRTLCNLHSHYFKVHNLAPNFPCPSCPHKNCCFYFESDLTDHIRKEHGTSIVSIVKSL